MEQVREDYMLMSQICDRTKSLGFLRDEFPATNFGDFTPINIK